MPQNAAEEAAMRVSLARGRPFGSAEWVQEAVVAMGLEHTVRAKGRPRKAGVVEKGG